MTLQLVRAVIVHRFDVVHITTETPIYLPFLCLLAMLPRRIRPKRSLTIVDCTLAGSLEHTPVESSYERQLLDSYRWYERLAALDGIYAWYKAFIEVAAERRSDRYRPILRAARYCFTDPARFVPQSLKERVVIFAGRLSEQKRPILFVDAVRMLHDRHPDLVSDWRFYIYGRGPLEAAVKQRITAHRLSEIIRVSHAINMAPAFAASRLFVSTQAIENFTSLAMLEAMAAGNAIVADDVGQTREFVTPGVNGWLASAATAEAFADAIATYLRHPEQFDTMAAASRRVATEVHTVDNFSKDIAAFWREVCGRSASA